ncbi:MAG: hypothetical protein WC516_03335 [Patescibacteria group bacterium]
MPSVKPKSRKKTSAKKTTRTKKSSNAAASSTTSYSKNIPPENNAPVERFNIDNNRNSAGNFNSSDDARYVNINEHHPDLQKKYQIMWLVIGLVTLALMIFWFWSLKAGVADSTKGFLNGDIQKEIQASIDKMKGDFEQAQQPLQNEIDLNNTKNDIINQLKDNLAEQTWPTHISEELDLSAQYPGNWYKNELSRSIVFSSYSTTGTPPGTSGQLTITKQNNLKNIGLSDWFGTTDRKKSDYMIDGSTLNISGQPAVKYIKKNADSKDLLWLIYVRKDKLIYEITATANNSQKTSYEEIFNKIIKTIKFLK